MDGVYSIEATHAYSLPMSQVGPLTFTVTVTLTDADGASASTTSTVVVGKLAAGVPVTMGELQFMDANTYAKASDFVAQGETGVAVINWGDGTSSLGTVTGGPGNGSGPQPFTITGVHTYAQDSYDQPNGQYAVTVTVTDVDGNVLTGTQYVSVARPPISLVVGSVEAMPGVAFSSVEVASFTVPEAADGASEFAAAINWGDGTPLDTTGVIVGSAGMYRVLGSHTYAAGGEYTLQVEILQDWQNPIGGANGGGRGEVRNPVGAAITGPRVVAGWSAYQYSVTNPGGRVLSWSLVGGIADNAWLWPTGGGNTAYNAYLSKTQAESEAYDLGLSYPGPTLKGNDSYVYAYFQNEAATGTIEVMIQPQGGGKPITTSIPIASFRLVIGNPNPTFKAGTVYGDDPQRTANISIDGVSSNRLYKTLEAGILRPGFVGMDWQASVHLIAPAGLNGDALKAAFQKIYVGFVQVVHVNLIRVYFPSQVLVGSNEGQTYLDTNQRGVFASFYDNSSQIGTQMNKNAFTLKNEDSPDIRFPVGFNERQATAYTVVAQETFTTDVAVMSWDAKDEDWPQARLQWMWDGAGRLVRDPDNAANVNWVPLSVPASLMPLTFKRITGIIRILNPQPSSWILNDGSNMVFPEPVYLPLSGDNRNITWASTPK